jgi:SAM-dependent methyltransferase
MVSGRVAAAVGVGVDAPMVGCEFRAVTDEPEPCCFDDWSAHYAKRARTRKLGGVSSDLIDELGRAGLEGRTLLDVGCGAVTAVGVDLSSASIAEARRISSERGLADRLRFEVADGSSAPLGSHDVVVLDKVFCCYPNVEGLLGNSLHAARAVYAFSVPPSSGLRGVGARAVTRIQNAWYRMRRRKYGGFQTYVHDVSQMDSRVREAGFERLFTRRRFAWDLAVYVRP